jgi:excisionase family DNA binding protein
MPANDPKYVKIATAAARYDLHKRAVYSWVKAGLLPARQTPGGTLLVDLRDVDRLLTAYTPVGGDGSDE